ncbi:hypothetical protein Pint_04380 [Pistacia integerrima]|uniref:Uncharacterized protein n=1 Tax=Pistacia integerrima TaxID=434235 RepID=A0ACC0Z3D9_9ROSI|nr:hypothetical protein Pint_04380 [Pistacia integerrima]
MSRLLLRISVWSLIILSIGELLFAADTITAGQSIRDGTDTLISSFQSFELGFFSPGNSNNRYLGIWYKISPGTVVWVANRNNPITDKNGVLTVNNDGNLVLLNGEKSIIWSSNSSKLPLDTLLSGMKLGWNLRTGFERYLTSWRSADDPSPGDSTYRLDITELPQLILRTGSKKVDNGMDTDFVAFP